MDTSLAGTIPRVAQNVTRRWTDESERGRSAVEFAFCSAILLWLLVDVLRRDAFATDFRYAFWPAGRHVLQGVSPFSPVVDFFRLPFVYPAPAALLFAPFETDPKAVQPVIASPEAPGQFRRSARRYLGHAQPLRNRRRVLWANIGRGPQTVGSLP